MTGLEFLNDATLAAAGLGWALLHALWMGTVLWLGLWVALGLLRRRAAWARYALCCGALVLLVGLPAQAGVSIKDIYSGHGAWSERHAVALMQEGAPDGVAGSLPGGWTASALRAAVEGRHDAMSPPALSGAASSRLGTGLALLALLWTLMASARLARLGRAFREAHALVRNSKPASPRWQEALLELRRRHDVPVVYLGVSDAIEVPAQVGWLRPAILLPRTAHAELSATEVEAILAHELAHVRRNDYAVNLLQSTLEALLFFHPAAHWIGARIRDEREFCSDDVARRSIRGSLADYVRTLAKLEQQRGATSPDLAMAVTDGSLLRRIRRLAEMNSTTDRPRFDVDLLLVAVTLLALWLPWQTVQRPLESSTLTVMQMELRQHRDYRVIYERAESEPMADEETGR